VGGNIKLTQDSDEEFWGPVQMLYYKINTFKKIKKCHDIIPETSRRDIRYWLYQSP